MKTQYIQYTPIPPQVPRQLAIDLLQSHGEVITLNPLVLEYHPIKAPRDCPNDEYYSTWYEITERIQFVPGLKKIGSSKVTFKGCFHDMPWGVQTHMYVPMGVDLRNKWQIKGSQPGEPPEPRELGSGAPVSGLYLKEEVDVKCNALAISFVKKEMKVAAQTMVERMLKKAELLDAGILQAMFENGKLKTFNPADRSQVMPTNSNTLAATPSPAPAHMSPGMINQWRPDTKSSDSRMSLYSQSSDSNIHPAYRTHSHDGPNQYGQIPHPEGKGLAVEMPGDYSYPTGSSSHHHNNSTSNSSTTLANHNRHFSDRHSQVSGSDISSPPTTEHRNSRWSYISSDNRSDTAGSQTTSHRTSPNPEAKQFSAELAGSGHRDVEVISGATTAATATAASQPPPPPPLPPKEQLTQSPQLQQQQQQQKGSPQQPQTYAHQAYNPQHYARFAGNGFA